MDLLALLAVAFLLVDVFFVLYGWLRRLLGEAEPDAIPSARLKISRRHPGYRHEPQGLRSFQAAILAAGLTCTFSVLVGFVVVAAIWLLG